MAHDHKKSSGASPGVDRRTLLRTAAWTAPAIVVATAAPAAANASGTFTAVSATASISGLFGQSKNVTFTVVFGGTSPGPHPVTFTSVTGDAGPYSGLPENRTYPDGGGSRLFGAKATSDPRGTSAVISYTVQGHGSGTIAVTIPND
jgi:hypothetical protein